MGKPVKEGFIEGWELGEKETVLETPVVKIKSGPVRCKRTGKSRSFYYLDFPGWVNVIAITKEKEMVLIEQYRYGTNRPELEIPGGVIEPGEDPVEAGCRELLEECGYKGDAPKLIGKVSPNPAIQGNYCYTVLVENVMKVSEQSMDDMEDIEIILKSEESVLQEFTEGTLPIEHGLVLNALCHYKNMKDCKL